MYAQCFDELILQTTVAKLTKKTSTKYFSFSFEALTSGKFIFAQLSHVGQLCGEGPAAPEDQRRVQDDPSCLHGEVHHDFMPTW